MTCFKLKRCFDVATEIFRSRHRNQLNTEKSYRNIIYWGHDMQNIPNTEVQVATSKNEAATRKQAKWRQHSVRTNILGRDRDDNYTRQCCNKNHNRNAVATRKAGSRH